MPGIIVAPDLGKALARREGIFTVSAEMKTLMCLCSPFNPMAGPCGGLDIMNIPLPYRQFQLAVIEAGKRFINRQAARGFEWYGGDLELHGPWPSLDLSKTMQDPEAPYWTNIENPDKDGEVHPEKALAGIITPTNNLLDFQLAGDFLFKDRMTDLEIS